MTISDLLHLPTGVRLPSLASDPRVVVDWVPALELDECGSCPDDLDSPPPPGVFQIRYAQWGMTDLTTAACSVECAQRELAWLLRDRPDSRDNTRDIHLLVPEKLRAKLPVPDSEDDEVFQGLYALKEYLRTVHASDVEEFRRKALAAVSSLGLARVEQLGRAS